MIIDLLRKDLSRVSVNVPALCGLKFYASVHHLVLVLRVNLPRTKTRSHCFERAFLAAP